MAETERSRELDRLLLSLKDVIDENTRGLCVDERTVARVNSSIERAARRQRPKGLFLGLAAAACLLVMAVSGALLLPGLTHPTAGGADDGIQLARARESVAADVQPLTLSAGGEAVSYLQDGTPLPYAVVDVDDYSEGYAVALASNGLYGYLDEDGRWAFAAIYEQASPVLDGCAEVTLSGGREMTVVMPEE